MILKSLLNTLRLALARTCNVLMRITSGVLPGYQEFGPALSLSLAILLPHGTCTSRAYSRPGVFCLHLT